MAKRLLVFLIFMGAMVGVGRIWLTPHSASVGTSTSAEAAINEPVYSIAVPSQAPIPKAALRLRIIANSDSKKDQAVKLQVRNAVVVYVAKILKGVTSSQQARSIVTAHVPQIEDMAQAIVHNQGFPYGAQTEVGKVQFPTKVYGNRVYPAGDYEALRIVLGHGKGRNWWCVLFPPLCFIDIASGDAVPNTGGFPDLPPLETIDVPNMTGGETKVAVRLASVDYGEELLKAVNGWFRG